MKVTIIGKPEDFIKKSRPEDALKYASVEKENSGVAEQKNVQDTDLDLDER